MCSAVTCSSCGKTTWQGCGQHVDAVMAGVPATQRCECARPVQRSFMGRLRGR